MTPTDPAVTEFSWEAYLKETDDFKRWEMLQNKDRLTYDHADNWIQTVRRIVAREKDAQAVEQGSRLVLAERERFRKILADVDNKFFQVAGPLEAVGWHNAIDAVVKELGLAGQDKVQSDASASLASKNRTEKATDEGFYDKLVEEIDDEGDEEKAAIELFRKAARETDDKKVKEG